MNYRLLYTLLFFSIAPLQAQLEDISELTLKNGMKVVLKPTIFDEKEFFVRVSALNGYVNLPATLRPAAESLHEIIWESGIGSMTGDQLSVFLFEKGLEVNFKIGPEERYIEGEGDIKSVEMLLDLIRELFVLARIDEKQLPTVRDRLKESINRMACDKSCQFDSLFYQINTENYAPLAPLSASSIDLITYENTQKVLMAAFHNPADFTAVITGDFDLKTMVPLVQRSLGTIPAERDNGIWIEPPVLTFPAGINQKVITPETTEDTLTRISFPIKTPINEFNIRILDLTVETIEARLRRILEEKYHDIYGIDVSYEFLLYPKMDKPWITLQFRADKDKTEALKTLIMEQLKDLKTAGPSNEDIAAARLLKKQSDEYWSKDNHFWVSILSQYYMMGWDKLQIEKNYKRSDVSKEQIDQAIKNYFSLDNYTIVTGGT